MTVNKIFNVNTLILLFVVVIAILCLVPMVLMLMISFTDEAEIVRNGYSLIPQAFSLEAYKMLFENGKQMLNSYGITILVTVVGTIAATLITGMASFAISNPWVKNRDKLSMYFFIPMVFSGGMVPWYMINKAIGLTDNLFALIIPTLIFNPFNMYLVRNYMKELPVSLLESAKLDGANDMVIAFRIYFPLSLPILATIALFYSIGYWNDWWNAIMLVSDIDLYPVQYFLLKLKSDSTMLSHMQRIGGSALQPSESLQMATGIITIGPIILVYPFLQRYFVKGLIVGSVKG